MNAESSDALWSERLARDFPMAFFGRDHSSGSLHRVYRRIAKSILPGRRHRAAVGPIGIFGYVDGMDANLTKIPSFFSPAWELQMIANRFSEQNSVVNLDSLVPVQHA